MALQGRKVTVDQIIRIKRLINTPSGNPVFVLYTSDGVYRTKPDAAVSYAIEPGSATLHSHRIEFTLEKGLIVDLMVLA